LLDFVFMNCTEMEISEDMQDFLANVEWFLTYNEEFSVIFPQL
jgi:hypothetical protein